MCGRFALYLSHREIREELAAQEWINEQAFVPRYNIAPRTQAPVLLPSASSSLPASESSTATPTPSTSTSPPPLILHTMKWGLVPHWSKYEDTKLNTINARSENLVESSGMWNSIKGRNRCAVVVNGYYEWMGKGKGKVPYYVKPQQGKGKGKLMLLAGMYDSVVLEGKTEAERLWTFTIVTTPAPKDLEWLHDRQPVILGSDEALRVWLDTGSSKAKSKPESSNPKLKAPELKWMYLLVGTPGLECYKVPTEVGKVGVESPTFVERVEERRDGIQAMFRRQVEMSPKKGVLKPGDKRKREEKEDVKKGEKDVKKREKDVKKVSEVIELSSDEEVVVTKKMKT